MGQPRDAWRRRAALVAAAAGDSNLDLQVDILDAADILSSGLFDAGGYNAASGVGMAAVPEPALPGTMAGVWLAAHRVRRKRLPLLKSRDRWQR
jgi:hypothetical protein